MADRVSASITIGGALPSALLADFIALIEQQRLSTEWDGEAFIVATCPIMPPSTSWRTKWHGASSRSLRRSA